MGKVGERDTCVDKDFRVVGLQALRVVGSECCTVDAEVSATMNGLCSLECSLTDPAVLILSLWLTSLGKQRPRRLLLNIID